MPRVCLDRQRPGIVALGDELSDEQAKAILAKFSQADPSSPVAKGMKESSTNTLRLGSNDALRKSLERSLDTTFRLDSPRMLSYSAEPGDFRLSAKHNLHSSSNGSLSLGADASTQLMHSVDTIITLLQSNLKFTKAIYRGTKKSLSGPGFEVGHLGSMRSRKSSFSPTSDTMVGTQSTRSLPRPSQFVTASSYAVTQSNYTRGSIPEGRESKESIRSEALAAMPPRIQDLAKMITQNLDERDKSTVKIWKFFEDKHSSRAAFWFDRFRNTLLVLSVVLATLESIEVSAFPWQEYNEKTTAYCQLFIEALFAIELSLRFYACRDRYTFCLSLFNVVDFISVSPCVLRVFVLLGRADSAEIVSLIGIVPVLRLLKLLQHSAKFHLLMSAFFAAAEVMPMLMFTMFLIASTFAATIYYFEPRSSMPDLPTSLYFAIVTCSTVGYGDFAPVTTPGRFFTSLLAIVGPMYMAMPIGIIGTAFSDVWHDRHRLLILQQMRKSVSNAGYSPAELMNIFKLLDQNGDGSLDYTEFVAWLEIMDISATESFCQQVFESFDADDEGTIDFEEFLRGLYPRSYGRMRYVVRKSEHGSRKSEHGVRKSEHGVRKSENAARKSERKHGLVSEYTVDDEATDYYGRHANGHSRKL